MIRSTDFVMNNIATLYRSHVNYSETYETLNSSKFLLIPQYALNQSKDTLIRQLYDNWSLSGSFKLKEIINTLDGSIEWTI